MPVGLKRIGRSAQRGIATLAIAMLILCVMALISLYMNRSVLMEIRSSANQYKAQQAFHAAEAGLVWAEALLNDPRGIDSKCVARSEAQSFRRKYIPSDTALVLQPTVEHHPACLMRSGDLECGCPEPGEIPSLGSDADASFAVTFEPVSGDTESVRLISKGCTGVSAECIPGADDDRPDAVASSSVILKLRPILRMIPGAALTAGGNVAVRPSAAIRNGNRTTSGMLIEAGGSVSIDEGARLQSLPGLPAKAAMIGNESSLNALLKSPAPGDSFFNAFFGMSIAHYRATRSVHVVESNTASSRAHDLLAAYRQGAQACFVEGDLSFDEAEIGSIDRPLLIVTQHPVACTHACVLHGLIYSDVTSRAAGNGAGMEVSGAMITRGDHVQAGGETATYDATALAHLRQQTTVFTRVPGSWRDF